MATAKVFESDGGQAVQLPKEFAFSSTEVEVFRRGDEVVLKERPGQDRGETLADAFDLIAELPAELAERRDRSPQRRKLD
jgi:antitoxin VapB